MKVTLSLVLLATVVALAQGAPANEKRLLSDIGCMPAMCFVDPCMMASCPTHPTAMCKQGCACSADFYDLAGQKVTC